MGDRPSWCNFKGSKLCNVTYIIREPLTPLIIKKNFLYYSPLCRGKSFVVLKRQTSKYDPDFLAFSLYIFPNIFKPIYSHVDVQFK